VSLSLPRFTLCWKARADSAGRHRFCVRSCMRHRRRGVKGVSLTLPLFTLVALVRPKARRKRRAPSCEKRKGALRANSVVAFLQLALCVLNLVHGVSSSTDLPGLKSQQRQHPQHLRPLYSTDARSDGAREGRRARVPGGKNNTPQTDSHAPIHHSHPSFLFISPSSHRPFLADHALVLTEAPCPVAEVFAPTHWGW
jgi:hypothetical protein